MKIEERSEELVKCVCAALIVCGRYFFENNEMEMGADLIKKATVSAAKWRHNQRLYSKFAYLLCKIVQAFLNEFNFGFCFPVLLCRKIYEELTVRPFE